MCYYFVLLFYDEKDVVRVLCCLYFVVYGECFFVVEGVEVEFYCVGYIIGVVMVILLVEGCCIVFFGDLGW